MQSENFKIDLKNLGDITREDIKGVHEACLDAGAQGMVLLKNNGMLPLKKGDKVAIFGRMQSHYLKSGWGSGGEVNVSYCTDILDSLKEKPIELNQDLLEVYANWEKENALVDKNLYDFPINYEEEMPITEELAAKAATESDKAIIVIARMQGEDSDMSAAAGSYYLTDIEYDLIKKVTAAFSDVLVLLNTGTIIDMSWEAELCPSAVLYAWYGGQDGGRATADVLMGERMPSGRLADTIAASLKDYPSADNFGKEAAVYAEDIFVGYRYFETFKKDSVLYPFGFGLSYTDFDIELLDAKEENGEIRISVSVKNIGDFAGRETVQLYYRAPIGALSRPARELGSFKKTKELLPGEAEEIILTLCAETMAGYDDLGVSGNKSCYILEAGDYNIYVGKNVRDAENVFTYKNESLKVTQKLNAVLAPNESFERMTNRGGSLSYKAVPCGEMTPCKVRFDEIEYTGDKGFKLADAGSGKITMEQFVAQLSDYDLLCLSQGEGMNSNKVRPGSAGAIGGLTKKLQHFGIPAICCTDGPSGLRLDNGDTAVSIPCGTLLACSWNVELPELLYTYIGMEAHLNNVDALLGPGVNIHRHPLCGRNFEYLSEDPILAGEMGKAFCRGLANVGKTATIKHLAANNQEIFRNTANSLVSERALREIYLKPFEMAIKDGKTTMIMTGYNLVNGVHCASSYDLATVLPRDEWGFDGLVMSDWWARTNEHTESKSDKKFPIMAQNDVFMVCKSAEEEADKLLPALEHGEITRAELQRNAVNILREIMRTTSYERYLKNGCEYPEAFADIGENQVFAEENIKNGAEFSLKKSDFGRLYIRLQYICTASVLAQLPIKVIMNGKCVKVFMINGTQGEIKIAESILDIADIDEDITLKLEFGENVIEIKKLEMLTD